MTTTTHSHQAWTDQGGQVSAVEALMAIDEGDLVDGHERDDGEGRREAEWIKTACHQELRRTAFSVKAKAEKRLTLPND